MRFFILLCCLCANAFAKPGLLRYAPIFPGAPIGLDGRVVDTPEVALAKAEHAAAHINEKLNHDAEILRSADFFIPAAHAPVAYDVAAPALRFAPAAGFLAHDDGRPLDTAEFAVAY